MPLTLRDVVARGTPLDWWDSVAIVQELVASVLANAGSDGPHVPDLPDILVHEDGFVSAVDSGGSHDQAPVFRLAHVLNTLLSGATPPVQLRLIVLSALSPEPAYKTVLEFSQALEYFERPDRRQLVRGVYTRAMLRPAPVGDAEVPALPERPDTPKPEPQPRKPSAHGRGLLFATGAAAVLLVIGAAGWLFASRPAGAKALAGTTQAVSKAMASAMDTVKKAFKPAPTPVVEAPPSAPAPRPAAKRALRPRPLRPARSFAQSGLPPIVTLAPTTDPVTWTQLLDNVDEVVYLNLPETPRDVAGPAVYSEGDQGVRGPIALHPKLPTEPPAGVPVQSLTRLELLVSATGEVDSVKIVSGPRDSLDAMMLSAVKAWKFRPATKDGVPVACRHQVWLTAR